MPVVQTVNMLTTMITPKWKVNHYQLAYEQANARKQEYMRAQRQRLRIRLTELMEKKGVKISQVRKDSGICFNTLQQILDGAPINITVATAWALSQYFDVPITEFL